MKQTKKLFTSAFAAIISYACVAHADSWGIKFLGRTTSTNYTAGPDLVTGTAGVVPISGWNNITNYQDSTGYGFTTGTIKSSDGSATATLTISGTTQGQNNSGGWQSGAPSDGGDGSLANGYLDLGANIGGAETNVISGLTGSSYTLYIYNYSDASHPGNGGDYLPNYSANGITYFAPQFGSAPTTWDTAGVPVGGPFTGWIKAKATLANYNTQVPDTNYFGNYLEIDNVQPIDGVITFVAQQSNQSWRSPLDGFELVLETQATMPVIDAQTLSSSNYAGSTVQVQVVAEGSPLNFQWQAGAVGSGVYTNLINGGQFSGVTNATLTISNFTPLNVGDYIVIITNSAGSVTSSVPTTLSALPMGFTSDITPGNSQVYPGESAFFQVAVGGSNPLTYQWRKSGVAISDGGHIFGANSNILVISNADAGDDGSYDVVVTNVFDSITSSPAMFNVVAAPVSGSYAENVETNGAVAYWRLNEADTDPTSGGAWAYDFIGGRAGAYGASTLNGYYGITGPSDPTWPGFEADNYALQIYPGYTNSFVEIPASEALNLNTNTVTITAWVNPQDALVPNAGIVFQRVNGVVGLNLGGNGDLGFNWNDSPSSWGWDSGLALPLNQWSFVALVVSPTKATIYMYNADTWTNSSVQIANANATFAGPLDIGIDSFDPMARAFDGYIDEVAIFKQALTPAQIAQQISVAAGVVVAPPVNPTISIQPSGQNVQITWTGTLLQSTNISGPWTTNTAGPSPLTVVPTGPQMFYRSE